MNMLPPLARLHPQLHAEGAHEALLADVLTRMGSSDAAHVFTTRFDDDALLAARAADARQARGEPALPLDGLPVTIKDLYDVAGRTTLAGSVLREGRAVATRDAPSVARLRAAGAAITGLTNMSEFAFSGVGINPHRGTPRNPADAAVARVPGGSSSGAAVSVALRLAVAGLGSDTGGSIRIPAALCGLVGFKSTQRRTPLAGAFPLSTTLDTVCSMSRSVADCLLVDGVLAGAPLQVPARTLAGARLLVPQTVVLDALDDTVARAFERALSRLSAAGAVIVQQPLPELAEVAQINAPGGLSAIEAFATHRDDMRTQRERFDHRVALRVALGEAVSAADYIHILRRRADWIVRMEARLQGFDALACPTTPIVAPEIAPLVGRDPESDAAFFKANNLLLRNTFPINFLDGCSFSLPCHGAGELPVGLMLSAPGGHDAALAALALAAEPLLQ
jgi:aspartyl-tRNA(Asn)/glutamyl-tRNA(Gln) amidotransferase subunit A